LAATAARPQTELSLGALEGRWLFEAQTNHQPRPEKVLEIKERKLVLSVTEPGGRVSLVAECQVKLDGRGDRRTVSLAEQGDYDFDEFLVCI
jgi:hypothetical protein